MDRSQIRLLKISVGIGVAVMLAFLVIPQDMKDRIVNKIQFGLNGASFKIKGRVLDQYDRPVAGAPVQIDIITGGQNHWLTGRLRSIPANVFKVYSNDDGLFEFDSGGFKSSAVSVFPRDFYNKEGVYYSHAVFNKHGLFYYENKIGWLPDRREYNRNIAPHDEIDGPINLDMPVQFRLSRNSGPQSMIDFSWVGDDIPGDMMQSSVNVLTGEATTQNCPDCDLKVIIRGCMSSCSKPGVHSTDGKAGYWEVELMAQQQGGIFLSEPRYSMGSDQYEAPPEGLHWIPAPYDMFHFDAPMRGYQEKVTLKFDKCVHGGLSSNDRMMFFHTRNKAIYGRLKYSFSCPDNFKGDVLTQKKVRPASFQVVANPRGSRNLNTENNGGRVSVGKIRLPVTLPFAEQKSRTDFNKIEIGTTKTGELFARGMPGAAPRAEYAWINNAASDKEKYRSEGKQIKVKPDGSFYVTLKCDPIGAVYLTINYLPGSDNDGNGHLENIPWATIPRLIEQAKKKD